MQQNTKSTHNNLIQVLYINNELNGKKLANVTFHNTMNNNYLKIDLNKEVKSLYNYKYSILKQGIEEDIEKWKITSYFWIGRNNIVKMAIFLNFKKIPIKMPSSSLKELEKIILKFILSQKGPEQQKNSWVRSEKQEE